MGLDQLLAGIAVVLALEGLAYALAPGAMRRVIDAVAARDDRELRIGGLVAAAIGIGLAWLVTAF